MKFQKFTDTVANHDDISLYLNQQSTDLPVFSPFPVRDKTTPEISIFQISGQPAAVSTIILVPLIFLLSDFVGWDYKTGDSVG